MGKQSKVINNKATDAFFTLVRAGLGKARGSFRSLPVLITR